MSTPASCARRGVADRQERRVLIFIYARAAMCTLDCVSSGKVKVTDHLKHLLYSPLEVLVSVRA